MSIDKKVKSNKLLLLFLGSVFVILGITLILVWWKDVVSLFRGFGGMFIALGGLLLLYMAKE
ncbi:MAG: hypothetical protein NUV91_01390 [Candidatus Omnitrophica bacterium]|nr:hypothetical protein [Candidatus Omnitrophota bacterium]